MAAGCSSLARWQRQEWRRFTHATLNKKTDVAFPKCRTTPSMYRFLYIHCCSNLPEAALLVYSAHYLQTNHVWLCNNSNNVPSCVFNDSWNSSIKFWVIIGTWRLLNLCSGIGQIVILVSFRSPTHSLRAKKVFQSGQINAVKHNCCSRCHYIW